MNSLILSRINFSLTNHNFSKYYSANFDEYWNNLRGMVDPFGNWWSVSIRFNGISKKTHYTLYYASNNTNIHLPSISPENLLSFQQQLKKPPPESSIIIDDVISPVFLGQESPRGSSSRATKGNRVTTLARIDWSLVFEHGRQTLFAHRPNVYVYVVTPSFGGSMRRIARYRVSAVRAVATTTPLPRVYCLVEPRGIIN